MTYPELFIIPYPIPTMIARATIWATKSKKIGNLKQYMNTANPIIPKNTLGCFWATWPINLSSAEITLHKKDKIC